MDLRAARVGIFLLGVWGCLPEEEDANAYAAKWATALCEARTRCGCAPAPEPEDCEALERQRFLELWNDTESIPREPCANDRLAQLEVLACDATERHLFEWELMTCPLRTSFAGANEPCLPLGTDAGGRTWMTCETGLVCDARTLHCATSTPGPAEREPCLYSSDPYGGLGQCGPELACQDDGVCRPGTPSAVPLPLLCSDAVYSF